MPWQKLFLNFFFVYFSYVFFSAGEAQLHAEDGRRLSRLCCQKPEIPGNVRAEAQQRQVRETKLAILGQFGRQLYFGRHANFCCDDCFTRVDFVVSLTLVVSLQYSLRRHRQLHALVGEVDRV